MSRVQRAHESLNENRHSSSGKQCAVLSCRHRNDDTMFVVQEKLSLHLFVSPHVFFPGIIQSIDMACIRYAIASVC